MPADFYMTSLLEAEDVSTPNGIPFGAPLVFRASEKFEPAVGFTITSLGNVIGASDINLFHTGEYGGGVKFDGVQVGDAIATAGSNVIRSASMNAIASDVGKLVVFWKAGAAGATLVSPIIGVDAADQVRVAANAGATVAADGLMCFGTDDTAAWRACIIAAVAACRATNFKSATIRPPNAGISIIAGDPTDTINSVLPFPNIRKGDDGLAAITITIKPAGPWTDTQYWGFPKEVPHLSGPILLFTSLGGGARPSCIGSGDESWAGVLITPCGTVGLALDNVTIRQLDPCRMDALNWFTAGDLYVGTICCDTFCRITDTAAPIAGTGVRFPCNGASATYVGWNVQVFRHFRGVELSNQSHLVHAFINFCPTGIAVRANSSGLGARIQWALVQRCSKLIEVIYEAGSGNNFALACDWLQTENSDSNDPVVWTRPALTGQIDDPGWALTGYVNVAMNFTGGFPTRNGAVRLLIRNLFNNETQGGFHSSWPLKFTNVADLGNMSIVLNDASANHLAGFAFQHGGVGKYSVVVDERYGAGQATISGYNAVLATYDSVYELANRDLRRRFVDKSAEASWNPWIDEDAYNGWMAGPYVRNGKLVWKLRLASTLYYATMTLTTTAP